MVVSPDNNNIKDFVKFDYVNSFGFNKNELKEILGENKTINGNYTLLQVFNSVRGIFKNNTFLHRGFENSVEFILSFENDEKSLFAINKDIVYPSNLEKLHIDNLIQLSRFITDLKEKKLEDNSISEDCEDFSVNIQNKIISILENEFGKDIIDYESIIEDNGGFDNVEIYRGMASAKLKSNYLKNEQELVEQIQEMIMSGDVLN